jgi:hypothetical protein
MMAQAIDEWECSECYQGLLQEIKKEYKDEKDTVENGTQK